ncbi:hypothetical protein [Flavobacterium sp. UBA4197]|uniref:hypothetical protein n=1 Tax=Flavobacterium sp. UBA4197 TaxID=1946546 RepID=UPI00257A80CC|nr:hypothetical protein [Flavobacterium sp. UBA4197]HRB72437.1 hypothetical protein [Flavobacterium sp.]
MSEKKNNKGLGNPAAATVVASSAAGQKAIEKATEVIPFVLKLTALGIGIYFIARKVSNRFEPRATKSEYPVANITKHEAEDRANALYSAMVGAGADLYAVASVLQGMNYNAYVLIYNAFGKRSGFLPFSKEMTLTEWIIDEFSVADRSYLRGLMGGIF